MLRRALPLAALVAAALPASAHADRAYNILPAGQFGGTPTTEHSRDQLPLYDALTPLKGDVTADTLTQLFKPETLAPVGATTDEATSRPSVSIKRDVWGVPHVYAGTREDLAYGVGWVEAEDRGLLLQLGRGPGRVAITDVPAVNAFGLVTALRSVAASAQANAFANQEADKLVDAYGAEGKTMLGELDAYAAGINAYYATQPGTPPAPWTRADTFSGFTFVGSIFGNGGGGEANNAQLLSQLTRKLGKKRGPKAFTDLMEANDPEAPTTISDTFKFGNGSARTTKGAPAIDAGSLKISADPTQPRQLASNVLLAGGNRTATPASLAVMGPQLGYFYPQIVMEIGLHGAGVDAQGAFAPGIGPYQLLGRTRDYAWSLTTAQNDNRDIFLEQLCGTRKYRYKGRCKAMKRFDTGTLAATSTAPETRLTFDTTVHGPVIGTAKVKGKRFAVVRARSTYGRDAVSLGALRDLMIGRGQTLKGFYKAANKFEYTFNFAYSSRQHVAAFSSGRIPRAEKGLNELLPRIGTGRYDWKGFLNEEEHPHQADPPGGLLLNWNNKPAPGWEPGDDVHTYGSVQRVEMFDTIPAKAKLEDVVGTMNRAATQDLRTEEVWPVIRAVLGTSAAPDARTAAAVALIDRWRTRGSSRLDADLDGKVDDPGAAVMDNAFVPLARAVLKAQLGSLLPSFESLVGIDDAPYRAGGNGSSFGGGWYGYVDKDLRTLLGRKVKGTFALRYCGKGSMERCRASLWSALSGAVGRLAAAQGEDPEAWRSDATAERISFLPGLIDDTMRWTNRPTFQQVLELDRKG